MLEKDFKVVSYHWRKGHINIPCNDGSMKYKCESDNLTYVSLTISNAEKDIYTIEVQAECGKADKSIEVQAPQFTNTESDNRTAGNLGLARSANVTLAVWTIFPVLMFFWHFILFSV